MICFQLMSRIRGVRLARHGSDARGASHAAGLARRELAVDIFPDRFDEDFAAFTGLETFEFPCREQLVESGSAAVEHAPRPTRAYDKGLVFSEPGTIDGHKRSTLHHERGRSLAKICLSSRFRRFRDVRKLEIR